MKKLLTNVQIITAFIWIAVILLSCYILGDSEFTKTICSILVIGAGINVTLLSNYVLRQK